MKGRHGIFITPQQHKDFLIQAIEDLSLQDLEKLTNFVNNLLPNNRQNDGLHDQPSPSFASSESESSKDQALILREAPQKRQAKPKVRVRKSSRRSQPESVQKRQKIDAAECAESKDEEVEQFQEFEDERLHSVQMIKQALQEAYSGLWFALVAGPYLELVDVETALEKRMEMLRNNKNITVSKLRELLGHGGGTKEELIRELSELYAEEANVSLHYSLDNPHTLMPCRLSVVPSESDRLKLTNNPDSFFSHFGELMQIWRSASNINVYSRDCCVALLWEREKEKCNSSAKVVDKLNHWFGEVKTHSPWAVRRRRGQLLLQYPEFAYQSVLRLDGIVLSVTTIQRLMESEPELKEMHTKLTMEYALVLGEPVDDAPRIADEEEDEFSLHTHGFVVHKGLAQEWLDDELCHLLVDVSTRGHVIFNNARVEDVNANDCKRLQFCIDNLMDDRVVEFRGCVSSTLRRMYPGHRANSMVTLRSEPGCADQKMHTDYPPTSNENLDIDTPLACIVAIEDETFLDVWPEAIRFDTTKQYFHKRIELNRGDVLIFRGDLVHAGASFNELNVRVHCYLDPVGVERNKFGDGSEVTHYVDHLENILSRGVKPGHFELV